MEHYGMAVRCNDLLRGRSYDVLGRIEIEGKMGKMGKEDDAEQELMAREPRRLPPEV